MSNKTFIIAEAGVNHNGSIKLAKKLVQVAKEAGADAVKFQTFITENSISKNAKKAEYQIQNTGIEETQFEMVKKLELSFAEFKELFDYCNTNDILFLSTPFDFESIDFLNNEIGMEIFKVPSGEITNVPYLIKVAQTNKKVILSTGMSTIEEIQLAVDLLVQNGCSEYSILHCTTEYPAPIEDVNLNCMSTLKNAFHCSIGYSDHTEGIVVPIAAAALGAEIIEKHFTLDKTMEGPDHKASLNPSELKEMIDAIRKTEMALGSYEKKPSPSELGNVLVARKSIVAKTSIKRGDVFNTENITTKRPGDGISAARWFEVLGQKATRDYEAEDQIEL